MANNPLISNEELAGKLGLKVDTIYEYKWRLRRNFVDIHKIQRFCPECFEESVYVDQENGERVCRKCGLVIERQPQFSEDLLWDTTYALTNYLAFDKSLGDTLPDRHLCHVIAKSSNGINDLPIRSTQINVIKNAVDPPMVTNMLHYGSNLLKSLDFNRDTDECHILADRYGRLLRKLAAYLQVSKARVQPHLVARAALYFMLKKSRHPKAKIARRKYSFSSKHYKLVLAFANLAKMLEEDS